MTSFAIFSDTTAPQTLEDGETAFIAAGASLSVDGDETTGAAIEATGANDIVVFGSVNAHNAGLIGHTGSSLDLYVSTEGRVFSAEGTAVTSSFTSAVSVTNNGRIDAVAYGLDLRATDGSGTIDIMNTGEIHSDAFGITTDSGSGVLRITNTGRIYGDTFAINNLSGDAFIVNHGEIEAIPDPDPLNPGGFGYYGAAGIDTFDNFGSVIGGIVTEGGNDVVTNRGTVDQVSLGNGADRFDGRGGTVTGEVAGGRGSDTYRIDQNAITLVELAGQGKDQIITRFDHELAENFENLLLTGKNDVDGTGNSVKNVLTGNSGANILKGLQGADTLTGLGGRDILRGGKGDDELFGGGGKDVLIGGLGKDVMFGGMGRDLFVFDKVKDSSNTDDFNIILDFEIGIDRIDLSGLIAGDFTFIGDGFFSGTSPEVRVATNGSKTVIRIDVDGDQIPDMKMVLLDVSGFQASDIIL